MAREQKGITLVALVITIVVLIILAGVAISLTLSDNGIFNRARNARDQYTNASKAEQDMVNGIDEAVNDVVNGMVF